MLSKMSENNLLFQGETVAVFQSYGKVSAFKRKLISWLKCLGNEEIDLFPISEQIHGCK